MQEAAEVAAWIRSHALSRLNLDKSRRLLLSQDRHQIFLTVAGFDSSYRDYLVNGTIGDDAFLTMHTYGPWNTLVESHMDELAVIVLSIVLRFVSPVEESA
ncbi:hypothetical protein BJX70DRAFT_359499, partial [Aspergillus crustosus]